MPRLARHPDCSHVLGTACVLAHDEVSAPLCLPTCDPFEPTCPEGHHCHPSALTPELFACTPDASLGAAFEACGKADCAAGLLCSEPEKAAVECAPDTNCCTPLCDQAPPTAPAPARSACPIMKWARPPRVSRTSAAAACRDPAPERATARLRPFVARGVEPARICPVRDREPDLPGPAGRRAGRRS
ncbi:hypothetical protein [Nannocystis pusilla]|uniref:hypothetical protein n=1 Tax=Nannocystis pusilla TaxID=889268 RepID=UPI003B7FBA54